MRRWLPLLLLPGCATDNPSLVVERQSSPLAQASDAAWKPGSVIFAGDPQAFTFPQPIALRFTIVDDVTAEMPMQLTIAQPKLAPFGTGTLAITVEPVCQAMYCTAEVSATAQGTSMLAIDATGPSGAERACFYYAVVDAATDTDALRADLEAQQQDCRFQ
ncbi:MAG TPA: hypothetical protein VIV40_39480 [Kofleriaceae bacterium]